MKVPGDKLARCPVCGATPSVWRTKSTDYGAFEIDECGRCKYAFVNPRPSLDFLIEFYESGAEQPDNPVQTVSSAADALEAESRFPNSTVDAERIVRTMLKLGPEPTNRRRFLDVGCGYGFFSREAKRGGLDVEAIELASLEAEIANAIAEIDPQKVTFESYEEEPGTFGFMLMSQILEHALDVNLWIAKANRLLADDGILAIALPNFGSIFRRVMQENEPYVTPPAHLNFFSSGCLETLLERHGFSVLKSESISRVPTVAFERRLPAGMKFAAPVMGRSANLMLKLFDQADMGQMINVYARKTRSVPASDA